MDKVTESVYNKGFDAGEKFFEEFKQNNQDSEYLDFLMGFVDGLWCMISDEEDSSYGVDDPDEYGTAVDSTGHGAHSRVNEND
jgi:hypothetical protein